MRTKNTSWPSTRRELTAASASRPAEETETVSGADGGRVVIPGRGDLDFKARIQHQYASNERTSSSQCDDLHLPPKRLTQHSRTRAASRGQPLVPLS